MDLILIFHFDPFRWGNIEWWIANIRQGVLLGVNIVNMVLQELERDLLEIFSLNWTVIYDLFSYSSCEVGISLSFEELTHICKNSVIIFLSIMLIGNNLDASTQTFHKCFSKNILFCDYFAWFIHTFKFSIYVSLFFSNCSSTL